MAEHVQAVLDRMVVGLVDMQQRGVLNAEEVTAVVARRRQSEYALRRRTPRQTDFLHYIAAETTLLRLVQLRERHLRREAFQNKDTTSRENPENDEGDDDDDDDNNKTSNNNDNSNKRTTPHVLRDLHLLWVRTLRKYRSQIDLYFQYAAFCKEQKSFTRLAACYQEAIRFHARCVPLWIEAASHEYFTNQSIQAARILLQRAIRIHKAHPQLWLQRFVLELHAAQKLKGRRRILRGPGDDTTTIPESSNEITTRDDKSINRDKPEDRDDHDDDYKIARLVFDHAVASVGGGGKTQSSNNNEDNVDWRLGCLRHCSQFPDTQGLEWHIVQSLRQQDCEQSPTAWIACAIYQQQKQQHSQNEEPANGTLAKRGRPSTPTNDDDDNEEVLEIIQQACKMVQTDEMLVQAVQFLQSYASHGGNDDDESEKEQSGGALVENRAEETHAVIRSLFANAKTSKIYNARVALRHAEYLMSLDNDNDDNITYAILVLSDYVQNHQEDRLRGRIPAALWIQWACLEYQCSNQNAKKAIEILKRASDSIPMHNKDHWSVLVQLFCLRVASISSNEEELDKLSDLFQQVLMLAPAHSYDVGQAIVEAIPNHPMACRLYLQHIREMRGLTAFRKACDCILVSAAFEKHWVVHHTEALRILLEDIIAVEQEETQHGKQRLGRIYGTAIRSFKGHFAELAEEYRSRKADDVDYNCARKRKLTSVDAANAHFKIPTLDLKETNFSEAQFERTYRDFQVVHVKNSTMGCKIPDDASSSEFRWQDIGGIFEKLSDKDKASWTVETMTTGDSAVLSNEFLVADPISHRAYCSFLIQNDEEIYRKTIQRLPFQEFPQTKWEYEPALWVFFCRNSIGNESLQGRPEHTDAITHDGTWHYQLSGRKQWRLRPTDELVLKLIEENSTLSTNDVFHVECCEGDVLVINTRLWFHNTIIPPQGCPSVSYARDFSLSESLCCTQGDDGGMTNLDGLYATIDVSYGTIVFTEDSMPDCALHRSSANANCEVVALDDGSQAVVSLRDIVAGEFFCVPDTSDEESSDGEGDVDIEESDGNDSGS